jgi:proteasome accessory factor A
MPVTKPGTHPERSRLCANATLNGTHEIRVYKNNSDHKGNSYGCHENYTVDAPTYQKLFRETGLRELIPFLVSRQIICGAGKVGQENSSGTRAGYQISQRADFCETVFSIKTMSGRPLLNTRDEPHADRRRFRRLHMILGDANMSEVSTYLKVGITQLVLRMIEDRAITRGVPLDAPVQALRDISLDTTCRVKVKLRDGRKVDAIELQSAYLEMAHAYAATHPLNIEERDVLHRWNAPYVCCVKIPCTCVASSTGSLRSGSSNSKSPSWPGLTAHAYANSTSNTTVLNPPRVYSMYSRIQARWSAYRRCRNRPFYHPSDR